MTNEKLLFPQLQIDNKVTPVRLFISYNDGFFMTLIDDSGGTYESGCGGFGPTLSELLLKLSPSCQPLSEHHVCIRMEHSISIKRHDGHSEILTLKECIQNVPELFMDEYTIQYTLTCLSEDKREIRTVSVEGDFVHALQKIVDQLDIELHTCAYCQYADFKSMGGEDLRHGWLCFREVGPIDFDIPWFMREDQFDQAIQNVDALYWCPAFQYRAIRRT